VLVVVITAGVLYFGGAVLLETLGQMHVPPPH
jgi:hypothetical protein